MAEEKKYYSLLTEIGEAVLTNALFAGEKVDITEMAVGDGGGAYFRPTAQMTRLQGEKWRGAVTVEKDAVSQNVIVVKAIVPYSVGGFTIREMGLFDSQGCMLSIENLPEVEKVKAESGAFFDYEVTSRIITSKSDMIQVSIDPTTIIASKKDIENHNVSMNSHENRFSTITADLSQGLAIIINHVKADDIHVTDYNKTQWDNSVNTAENALDLANNNETRINIYESRIKRLEDGVYSNLIKNPFLISFGNLEGINLVKGCWNKNKQRIEC